MNPGQPLSLLRPDLELPEECLGGGRGAELPGAGAEAQHRDVGLVAGRREQRVLAAGVDQPPGQGRV